MKIPIHVLGISQEFNFSTQRQETYAVLELPNGSQFRVPIEEVVAGTLIEMAVKQGGVPASSPSGSAPAPMYSGPSSAFKPTTLDDGTPVLSFGGDGSKLEDSLLIEEVEAKLAGELTPEQKARKSMNEARTSGTVAPATSMKPRMVGVDETGNPIMEYPNGVPSEVITAPRDQDEDGVGQV